MNGRSRLRRAPGSVRPRDPGRATPLPRRRRRPVPPERSGPRRSRRTRPERNRPVNTVTPDRRRRPVAREEAAASRRTIPLHGQLRVLRRRERTGLPPTDPEAKERAGCPTRKPPASPDRIIRASGGPGDIVLDPFCGCAATPAAPETLGGRRAGIDLLSPAVKPVGQRLRGRRGLFGGRVPRDCVPKRTDIGERPTENAPARVVRAAGRGLRRAPRSLSVPQPDSRSSRAAVGGWHGSDLRPAAAAGRVQPEEGQPPDGAIGSGVSGGSTAA